jgi:hypothetical protein
MTKQINRLGLVRRTATNIRLVAMLAEQQSALVKLSANIRRTNFY